MNRRDAAAGDPCGRPTCGRSAAKNSNLCRPHFLQERDKGRCGLVDAAPIRGHIRALMANGWSPADIANVSGVTHSLIRAHADGLMGRIRAGTANRILAVTLTTPLPTTPFVTCDALGFVRRAQALACLGWRQTDLAERLGCHPRDVVNPTYKGRVSRALHAAMVDLYERLQATPGPSSYTAVRARSRGWVPPCGWETIDDPNETPNVEGDTAGDPDLIDIDPVSVRLVVDGGDPNKLNRAERLEAARVLVTVKQVSPSRAAVLLRMSHKTVKRAVAA